MLTVVCWKWKAPHGYRSTFLGEHVNVLRNMVKRHYNGKHRFICMTDDPSGIDRARVKVLPLWDDHSAIESPYGKSNPSCYRRLRMFSDEARDYFGDRFVSIDLDCVITSDVTPLWDRPEDFVIWGNTNPTTPYNGSMMLLKAGSRSRVWTEFDPVESPKLAKKLKYFGSDQAWISACLGPNESIWTKNDGVHSFRNQIQRAGLQPNSRIVFFHGVHDPWDADIQKLSWVREHWQ